MLGPQNIPQFLPQLAMCELWKLGVTFIKTKQKSQKSVKFS